MGIATITPQELQDLINRGAPIELYDVRTPAEYQEVHVGFAQNRPLDRLDPPGLLTKPRDANHPIYVICRSGSRGQQACEQLLRAGCANVVNVAGGTLAWEQAGLPVLRGKKTMSLERQVRIAAGSLVLIGVAMGVFVHPYALGLSAFVGAGLIFAGITDTCGMGMILARMPWNQASSAACAAAPAKTCSVETKTPV